MSLDRFKNRKYIACVSRRPLKKDRHVNNYTMSHIHSDRKIKDGRPSHPGHWGLVNIT
jgi:hypothetical protein